MNNVVAKLYDQALMIESNDDYVAGELDIEKFAESVENQTHTNNKAKWYQEGYDAGQHDEREACVKLCEEVLSEYYGSELQSAAARCAYLISTRGEKL